jgi:pimeloyl-ACP methyl ester carboxylesterase
VFRNNSILKQLFKERWVKTNQLLVAGHSEGSTVAVKMASLNKKITHLIYSGGNPYGRITSILEQSRSQETESLPQGQKVVEHWKNIVANPTQIQYDGGDTFKATYSFSLPQRDNLMQLKIPVLITYGTEDWSVAYNDLFQIEAIQQHKRNITFKNYVGLEHNYFSKNEKGEIIEEEYNWDKVARDWLEWLKKCER